MQRHLDHGDFEGSCEETKTYVPDDIFEGYLVCKGWDDVMDDYVLTKNIKNVEEMYLPHDGGSDCSGMPLLSPDHLTGLQDFTGLKLLSMAAGIEVSLDLSTLVNLEDLRIYAGSTLETLTISNCSKLRNLVIGDMTNLNSLQNLDITNNTVLERIYLHRLLYLKNLDFSKGINLKLVILENESYISKIDLSNSPLLETFVFEEGYQTMPSINLKNGNNQNISRLSIYNGMPICVQVDDAEYSELNWTDIVGNVNFSEDCGY